ncbi:universal stress protein [Polaribacter vadi]|uniref:Universal stress protein n=1 Tax=Polaribacter vadi TaxID=1774273 RepID=A0A1B8TX09_9FLAO|nr:universal stress protein [Polaribacter vadi]AOW16830.1 universal stress protein [Polaribacter vadi]OBY64261.1 universal stress protein [Polaribacter vadi]
MKNILLPTDFSENSWNAIVYAINFYKNDACTFYLLNVGGFASIVTDTPYIPDSKVLEQDYINPAKIKLRNIIKRISVEFPTNKKHKFYMLAEYSYLIDAIRKHVKEKKIDIIVMGTKGASGLKEKIVGSNAGDVITKVACTTLIVPENAKFKELKEIAFPTDFVLHYNIQALEPIFEITEHKEASLRVVHISKQEAVLNIDQQNNKNLLEDLLYNRNYSFHTLTNKKVEDAVQCFVESRDIDMIVMVAKNLNYFQQLFFHTKVEKISYHTSVPFFVLHE